MTATKPRRQVLLLGGLSAVLATLVIFQVLPMLTSGDGLPASPQGAATPGTGPLRLPGVVEEVALARLNDPWPEPIGSRRSPFSMTPDPPPASAAASVPKITEPVPAIPVGPPPPPPVPPITLKYIGVVSGSPAKVGKIAALTDGKFVFRGREGEIVEGRYRIVKIGEESIQVEYVNGTGRQTIRLSGK